MRLKPDKKPLTNHNNHGQVNFYHALKTDNIDICIHHVPTLMALSDSLLSHPMHRQALREVLPIHWLYDDSLRTEIKPLKLGQIHRESLAGTPKTSLLFRLLECNYGGGRATLPCLCIEAHC